ncbi:mucin-2-like [Wyeomyia smithii]|uniref:mucin-2-like n=1 Tax=Wyeomyia smithii TaxID=174621 RepID=UPI0024681872|nr:mucin-2-like [Wyeomyia smithii]
MKYKSLLLLCSLWLIGPAVGLPNREPIFRNNPLEVTEELIPTTNAPPPVDEEHHTTTGASSTAAPTAAAPSSPSSPTVVTPTSPAPSTATPVKEENGSPPFKRPEGSLKSKLASTGYVVATSTKILTSAGIQQYPKAPIISEGKANDHVVKYEKFVGHTGVAEPVPLDDYHKELIKPTERIHVRQQTTTPREGLSTWVLLSGSNSVTSTESKKEILNSTKRPFTTTTATTKRPATTSGRKPVTTPRRRTTSSTRTTSILSDEKKEKINKFITRIKASSLQDASKPKVEDVSLITKKTKKPLPTAATTTTAVPTTTTAATTTTTELSINESASVAPEENPEDNAVETSTFLILEPKDAMFDLPEDRSPTKVGKKKPTRKTTTSTKKKPIKKKGDDGLSKPGEKKPPSKSKPVTTQIMNFLSREVMPTVGVGLVGLVITAGLASYFLGSPLTAALRRSDETNRKDDVYFSNYEDYATTDGQNEEEVFGKLIAGMPERSYYRNNIRRRISQPTRTGHQYGNYHVQSYSANKYPHINYRTRPAYAGTPEMYAMYNRNVQAKSHNEFFYNTPPSYQAKMSSPLYTPSEGPVYTTTTTTTTTTQTPPLTTAAESAPSSMEGMDDTDGSEHEMLPNPAAYTGAEHRPEHHAQYVVGSVYRQPDNSMLDIITSAPVPEHGPRRRKRELSVGRTDENDMDNEIPGSENKKPATETSAEVTFDEQNKPDTSSSTPSGESGPITWSELIRNTVEMKMVLGIRLLQQMTSQFQRYLNGVQHRVDGVFNQTAVRQ